MTRRARFIDISTPIEPSMAVYEGDPPVAVEPFDAGGCRVSRLQFGTHTGTHVDPALHLYPGAQPVDEIPLDVLCGPARVVTVAEPGELDARAMAAEGAERLLLRTHGRAWLGAQSARFLREVGIRLIGVDRLSIDAEGLNAHKELLEGESPVVILEGLDLSGAPDGEYELICLPLRVRGGDGSPARAILRTAW